MTACGLDFGTSNTTVGVARGNGFGLLALEGDEVTIPSAVFYSRETAPAIGRAAVDAYVDGASGRLMRSLKSVLGSSLLDETTQLGRRRMPFREVIADFLGAVKTRAEAALGREIDSVVHGRPVHFVDGDPEADRAAEAALADIARGVGFRQVTFQYEPIAAALDFELQLDSEALALIADIGGGTSDFSLVRLGPEGRKRTDRAGDVLANDGVRIGGTDFDRRLNLDLVMPLLGYRSPMLRTGLEAPLVYFHDLATWATINRLYTPRAAREIEEVRRESARPELIARLLRVVEMQRGHSLAMAVEGAKIALSDQPDTAIDLGWVEPGLAARMDRPALARHGADLAARIGARVRNCLAQAGIAAEAVQALFLTGGTTRLAPVRDAITAMLPAAGVVEGDIFGSVGTGLAVEAARRYG